MKRSVAVRGPTPMFVRWAIELRCPVREIHAKRIPETTFRQLRSIRELSLSRQQGRVHAGFCLHPRNEVGSPESALGFSVDEVASLFGGLTAIESSCQDCPANAGAELDDGFWAGCFGIVSADLRWNLDSIIRGELAGTVDGSNIHSASSSQPDPSQADPNQIELPNQPSGPSDSDKMFDLIQIVNEATGQACRSDVDTPGGHPATAVPIWVRLWQEPVPSSDHLLLLEQTITRTLEFLDSIVVRSMTCDLRQFLHAVRRSRKYDLPLHVELVPAGISEGQTWRLYPHCQNCKQTWLDPSRPCPICGPRGMYQNEIRLKVLGLRPYLRLVDLIGLEETKRLLTFNPEM